MEEVKVLELFGGIGAIRKAFEKCKIPYKVIDYVEIDKYAVKSYNAMFNESFEPQDITTWDKDINVGFIMHGSPCQDFSVAGKQAGGDIGTGTRSSLMYETIRIVNKLKPKYVIWENVKNLLSKNHIHNFNNYINIMCEGGYNSYYKILNAKDYGIPQNRERVYTISIRKDIDKGFEFPPKEELKLKLKDMLEDVVDENYYVTDKMKKYILDLDEKQCNTKWSNRTNEGKINPSIAYTLGVRSAGGNQRAGVSNFILDNTDDEITVKSLKIKNNTKLGYLEAHEGDGVYTNITNKRGTVQPQTIQTITTRRDLGVVEKGLKIRKLTPKECWRLMGFDDKDFEKAKNTGMSNTQLYKQAGNSIVVNVLEKIFTNLFRR